MTPITSQQAADEIGKARPPNVLKRSLSLAPLRDAIKTWKTVPRSRLIILFYAVRSWFLLWSAWVVLGAISRADPHSWLIGVVIAIVVTTFSLLMFYGSRPGFTFLILSLIWLGFLWVGSFGTWLMLWGIGSLLLLILLVASLFIPIWTMEVKQNDVYITEDNTHHSEGFMLKSRARAKLDDSLRSELLKSGLPADLLDKYLKFGAPRFMDTELKEKIKPGSDQLLRRLRDKMDDPDSHESNILHIAAMDNVRLLWDKSKKMTVNSRLDQVITEGGSPVNIQLQFDFYFDPEVIRAPEFRLLLNKWESMTDLETVLKGAMEGAARKEVKLHFVNTPLDSALTKGSIEKFREVLPGKLVWAKDALGILLKADSVQCTPIIHETVQEAETQMIAARAQARADLARMRELLNHVILGGVPPKLLAGLMMVDQGVESLSLSHRTDDMLNLPDADDSQRFLFYKNKYGFAPTSPTESLPQSTTPTAAEPASTPEDTKPMPEAPPPEPEPPPSHKPDNPTPGDRRRVNLGKLVAKRGSDGVFRPDSDGN